MTLERFNEHLLGPKHVGDTVLGVFRLLSPIHSLPRYQTSSLMPNLIN